MPLHLITGGANTGKSALLWAELMQASSDRITGLLTVPAAPDVSRAMQSLAAHGCVGVGVQTLDGLLDELWRRLGDGRTIATPVQRLAILEESTRIWKPESLSGDTRSPGMLGLLGRVVERVAESPHEPVGDALVAGAGRDFLECAAIYRRLLRRAGLVERGEAHRLATAALDASLLPGLLAIDGFTGLTAAQERFVVGAARCCDVLLALTYDPEVPATSSASDLVQRLEAAERTHLVREFDGRELSRVRCFLGRQLQQDASDIGAVVFSEGWGRAAEHARIVREIQEALAEGYQPEDIAVVLRDAGPHLDGIRGALAEAGIEATFDARLPFSATPLGKAITALLEIEVLSHNRIMDLLRTPYSPATAVILDEYDAHARRTRRFSVADAERWLASRDGPTSEFVRRMRRAARTPVPADLEKALHALLAEMLGRAGDADLVRDAPAARVVMDAASSLRSVAGTGRAAEILLDVLKSATVIVSQRELPGRVHVMGAERCRGGSYRMVIVAGLNTGDFPRPSREDALDDPGVAHALARAGIDMGRRTGLDEERLLFYLVLTRASERLVLSRQSHSEDGEALRPSIFLEEVLDLYRDPVTKEYYEAEPPFRRLGLDGMATGPHAPITPRRELRRQLLEGQPEDGRAREARRRASRTDEQLSEEVRRLMAGRQHFSASELETYGQCPYRWAIQRLVQPRELDEVVDHAAAGLLGHEILRRFYEALPALTGIHRVTDDTLERARVLHEEIAGQCVAELGPLSAVDALACRTVVRRTLGVIEDDAQLLPAFQPIAHEWSFGLDEGDPAEAFEGFSLVGRIDRIDSDGQRLVLTDYKSGTIEAEHGVARFETEGVLQLPLYAAVAARRFDMEVAAVLYRPLRGGKPRGFVRDDLASTSFVRTDIVTAAEAIDSVSAAVETAGVVVSRMREGDIGQDPRNGTCVRYCPARDFCGNWRPPRG